MKTETKEKQYQAEVDETLKLGQVKMGLRASYIWRNDPKLLGITLSRHKFVSKMLSPYPRVLEIGCGDAFASVIIKKEVQKLYSIDFDPVYVEDAKSRAESGVFHDFAVHDILSGPYVNGNPFDAAFCLDVIEHIPKDQEKKFINNIAKSLTEDGVLICGTPSLESQVYASRASREGHVNCKSGSELQSLFLKHFKHAFLFCMNDEVLHTGYSPMAHYLFIIATGKKDQIF
jgi:2-polyprenyl-3-methyl-5-hydroxy-6-metoxy-1,4-benzoquinol methylase